MKLYTKRGDDGSTDLLGGLRVGKDSSRIETTGTVDELNSAIGLAASVCSLDQIKPILTLIQNQLFELGSDLACPTNPVQAPSLTIPRITHTHISELEKAIDRICSQLPPMKHFILPGGSELASRLHAARTICRRAERSCVKLSQAEKLNPEIIIYLNRLGDLLFALARWANKLQNVDDVPWFPQKPA